MATRNNIRGFIPTRHMHGLTSFNQTLRPTLARNDDHLFAGDVVFLDTSGGIQRYADVVSAIADLPLGVIGQVLNGDKRPFTFNLPGAQPHIPASTKGFALVYEDPFIIFVANASATATMLDVGKFQQVHVCAPNSAAGRSGMGVDLVNAATAAGHVLKLYNVSPQDSLLEETAELSGGDGNQDVEVLFVNHQWTHPHRRDEAGVGTSAGS